MPHTPLIGAHGLFVERRFSAFDRRRLVHDGLLAALADGPSFRKMMAVTLAEAQTLSVERAEPFATDAGKVPALHKVR